jgi:hypothetical protein
MRSGPIILFSRVYEKIAPVSSSIAVASNWNAAWERIGIVPGSSTGGFVFSLCRNWSAPQAVSILARASYQSESVIC